ncbi:preprotein translocase subunit YajC [Nocardioides speluncae]|uniref:preprotein translocase subunit YajC n=1 Tax=Nocardioides speluncae TaxID=2670337 RepID=UPI00137B6C58|nr:preprotein translocase subunit YajC [Nocardioides speluncae]
MSDLYALIPLVGIVLLFWLLMVRPAARRNKELGQMQAELAVGDEVMIGAGVFGKIHSVDGDDRLKLEIADGVVVEVARGAVVKVVNDRSK